MGTIRCGQSEVSVAIGDAMSEASPAVNSIALLKCLMYTDDEPNSVVSCI